MAQVKLRALAFAVLLSAAVPAVAAGAEGPVVIYLIDTLRADRVSVYGSPRATTPAAERLAKEADVFENAYSVSSWTRPSVGTLLTSLLPAEAGTLGRYGKLDPAVLYLPQMFQRRGWKTAAFVSNGNIFDARTGFGRGFDSFAAVTSKVNPEISRALAREVVDPVVEFLRSQTSPRFFLYVHVVDPHAEYFLEPPYKELFGRAESAGTMSERERRLLDYDRAIRQADDQFGRIVDLLREKGIWSGATVIYTSDHGEELLEHGGYGHGLTLFEEQIRIPLIVKFPAGSAKPRRRRDSVTLADLTPTLASMFGLEKGARWVGTDLARSSPERPVYFTEDMDSARLFALRKGSRKLIVRLYPKFEMSVYDLARDPGETSGRALTCSPSSDPNERALRALGDHWREREMPFFSGLRLEKSAIQPLALDFVANLADVDKPFLTAEDSCSFAPRIDKRALSIKEDLKATTSFRLALSTDDKGNPVPFRLSVIDGQGRMVDVHSKRSAFRLDRIERPRIEGPTTDEVLQNLKSLGYIGGAIH